MSSGRVLIYGGRGTLGSKCVSHFKSNNWWVASVGTSVNPEADLNIVIATTDDPTIQEKTVLNKVEDTLNGEKFDAILCVAGGWIGGNAEKDLVKNCQLMWQKSIVPSLISTSVATKYLKDGGLLSLTGAKAALDATPGMVGYGMAKSAVHFLAKSISSEKSGLPKDTVTVALLPTILDTPLNRKWMPNNDGSTWTSLEFVADLFLRWSKGENRPTNGSLLKLVTENFETHVILVE